MVIRRNVRGDGRSALMTGRSRHHIAHRADTVAVGFLRPDVLDDDGVTGCRRPAHHSPMVVKRFAWTVWRSVCGRSWMTVNATAVGSVRRHNPPDGRRRVGDGRQTVRQGKVPRWLRRIGRTVVATVQRNGPPDGHRSGRLEDVAAIRCQSGDAARIVAAIGLGRTRQGAAAPGGSR